MEHRLSDHNGESADEGSGTENVGAIKGLVAGVSSMLENLPNVMSESLAKSMGENIGKAFEKALEFKKEKFGVEGIGQVMTAIDELKTKGFTAVQETKKDAYFRDKISGKALEYAMAGVVPELSYMVQATGIEYREGKDFWTAKQLKKVKQGTAEAKVYRGVFSEFMHGLRLFKL